MITVLSALPLAGCGALPDKPLRSVVYDFGPPPGADVAGTQAGAPAAALAPITLPEIEAAAPFDGSAMYYRLAYDNVQVLRAYSQARWSAPPAELVRSRLRDALARRRTVLDRREAATLARSNGARPRVLRLQLDECSQWFDSASRSAGLLRLRATLIEPTAAGDRVLAQRSLQVRQVAPTPDAPGGAQAIAAATDEAVAQLQAWIDQQP